jgi:hypothetical protein
MWPFSKATEPKPFAVAKRISEPGSNPITFRVLANGPKDAFDAVGFDKYAFHPELDGIECQKITIESSEYLMAGDYTGLFLVSVHFGSIEERIRREALELSCSQAVCCWSC